MRWLVLVPLILVVAGTGCIQNGGLNFGFFGGETKEASPDVLKVQNVYVKPEPPISASTEDISSTFTLSFEVKNIAENWEEGGETGSVNVSVYDWGRCEPVDKVKKEIGPIYPGQVKMAEFKFKAPTNKNIGGMTNTCPISYKLSYNYSAQTISDFIVANENYIQQKQTAGEGLDVSPTQTRTRGPLKIEMEFGSEQPFKNGTKTQMKIKVLNKGEGDYSEIGKENLLLTLPKALKKSDGNNLKCNKDFHIDDDGKKEVTASNEEPIPFIGKESQPIICTLQVPNVDKLKTYQIKATIPDYVYSINKEEEVDIKPVYTG